ncbi:MAG: helix-turn-helix transcriptional regulator [Lachnospiraceae bacterium]|nr:helix-turn-helix transcriptional regulator [Lachnospiraceae bacterium]
MTIGENAKETRIERGFSPEQVCTGLCSETQYRNYENGHRELDVFIQTRIMERLGHSTKKMYYMLQPPAWECFCQRTEILYDLVKEQYDAAKEKIVLFSKCDAIKEPLHAQYLYRMQAFCEMCTGGENADIAVFLEKALIQTVSGFATKKYGEQCLAVCETDMLLDWFYYKAEHEPEDILEIITYCEKCGYDGIQMSQIYPKAVWYAYEIAKGKCPITKWQLIDILNYQSLFTKAVSHLRKQKMGIICGRCFLHTRSCFGLK